MWSFLFICSGTSASSRHMFISIARVEVFERESIYFIVALFFFQNWHFFSVALRESICIFAFGPSSPNSFPMLLIDSAIFIMFFWLPYFVPIASGCWYVFVPSPSDCFFFSLFCLYCFILSRYLFALPSFASTFWFISFYCIVIFTCGAF